jgi:hypothetical protein
MLYILTYFSSFIYRVIKTEEPADIKPVIKEVRINITGHDGIVCSVVSERAFLPKLALTWVPISGRNWLNVDMQKFCIQILYLSRFLERDSVMPQDSEIFWTLTSFCKLFNARFDLSKIVD